MWKVEYTPRFLKNMYQTITDLADRQEYEMQDVPSLLLKKMYESCCEEYRRRINEQWDLDIKDSWWIPSDRIGMTLALCDLEYSLGMEDVKLMVDLNVSYDDFCEWWNHCLGDTKYHINAFSWFVNGARSKDLK